MKKAYKQLRKKLKNKFKNPYNNEYNVIDAIRSWIEQSGIKFKDEHQAILLKINNNTIFYPYQKKDRKRILKYLKEYKKCP